MEMNHIGKFETRTIMNDIDAILIETYGVNMLDARIYRKEALDAYSECGDSRSAVQFLAKQHGLKKLGDTP